MAVTTDLRWWASLTLVLTACADPGPEARPWALEDTDAAFDDGAGTGGAEDGAWDGSDSGGPGPDGGPDPAGGSDGGTMDDGGPTFDCTPGWATPWIGSPCVDDGDCSFPGGECLRAAEGFPCGTCTQACDSLCPDTDGAPTTFCIDGTDVALPQQGYCLSQCDDALFDGGCRDGYACEVLERVDGTALADVCIPADMASGDMGLVDEIDHTFLIEYLGGYAADPFDYPSTLEGFQMYLDAVGVQYASAAEIAEPYNMTAAMMCGYTILLPERDEWEKAGALAMFTDHLTELVGEPIFMRNWWRPPCYNDAVGGAPNGDHPDADAVDLDFLSPTSRAIGQKWLCENFWDRDIVEPSQIAPGSNLDPRLNMSVGLGGVTIHLGVLSQGGRRYWLYDSYTSEPDDGGCW